MVNRRYDCSIREEGSTMAMIEMMYVYFDINGDIKTISPDPIMVSESYSVATFLLTDVEGFLTGKKNPFDYYVKITKQTYKITRKQVLDISYVRTLDNFLTEIKTLPKSADAFVLIENIVEEKKIKISLNKIVRVLLEDGSDVDQETVSSFINHSSTALFFTRKSDPYYLLHTLTFSPRELFDRSELYWDYTVNLSNSSVYTKKILDGYSYRIK